MLLCGAQHGVTHIWTNVILCNNNYITVVLFPHFFLHCFFLTLPDTWGYLHMDWNLLRFLEHSNQKSSSHCHILVHVEDSYLNDWVSKYVNFKHCWATKATDPKHLLISLSQTVNIAHYLSCLSHTARSHSFIKAFTTVAKHSGGQCRWCKCKLVYTTHINCNLS